MIKFKMSIYSLWSTVFLIFFCMANQARAVEDLVQTPIESSIIFNSDVACGTYLYGKYYARENGGTRSPSGTVVSSTGSIARDATITYATLGAATVLNITHNVTAKITYDEVKTAVAANPSKYPKLSSSLSTVTNTTSDDIISSPRLLNENSTISGIKYLDGGYVNGLVQVGPAYSSYHNSTSCAPFYNSGVFVALSDYSGTPSNGTCTDGSPSRSGTEVLYRPSSIVTTPSTLVYDATPAQFAQKISNSSLPLSAPANVYSDYYGEIDDFIRSNPNVVHYKDSSDSSSVDTAPDFVGPLGNCRDLANANAAQYMKPSCLNVQ